jgi:NAD(P)H-nitrite reductase large subunit
MKAPKDKRTKEYKQWKKKYNKASDGLGDTVEKITEATGIKKAVKWLAGEDCGCDERKEKLNKMWSYRKPKCFTENEYNTLSKWFSASRNQVSHSWQVELLKIYNRVFSEQRETSSCSSCVKEIIYDLQKLYKEYN